MVQFHILLSQDEYARYLTSYLINRVIFQIIKAVLWSIIIITIIFHIFKINNSNILYSIFLCILMIVYETIMPNLIYKKAKNIYDNTLFLHQKMNLEFDQNQVIWTTIKGENTFTLKSIFKVKALKDVLIISLTPYIILPIKYTSISPDQWNQLVNYLSLSKQATNYYNKFSVNKELL